MQDPQALHVQAVQEQINEEKKVSAFFSFFPFGQYYLLRFFLPALDFCPLEKKGYCVERSF